MASFLTGLSSPRKPRKLVGAPNPPAQAKNLLEPDYADAYNAWKTDPNKENTRQILTTLEPVIGSALRSYGGPSASSPTLRSQAKLEILDALSSYDPEKAPLKPHLMSRLQRLRRTAAQQRQIVQVPEQVSMHQMQTEQATRELEDRLNRKPSDQELADYTGLSLKRLEYIRSGGRALAESTITRPGEEGAGQFDPAVTSMGTSADPWVELVYTDMDTTNQYIMEHALGLHGHPPMSNTDIAKALKISPAAVTHRQKHIQSRLDQRHELGVL